MAGHLRLRVMTVYPADDTPAFLLLRIQVSCELCSDQEIVVAGHHIKPLLALLGSVLRDVDPALVDDGGEGTLIADGTLVEGEEALVDDDEIDLTAKKRSH